MVEPLWKLDEVAAVLGTPFHHASPHAAFTGVSIDSRTVAPGDLFIAIKGDRTDGHKFIDAALAKGAAAVIVSEDYAASADARTRPMFVVPDTLEALNALGRAARGRSNANVIGVTGSVGKTGTKEMLRLMLAACGETHASEKSYNNLWGVPLSLARMPKSAQFGVFEIGMNHAGEITPLTKMVQPHVAIITWVAPVHIEFFNSVADIADAKAEIFDGMQTGGYAVLPADNEHFDRLAGHAHHGRKLEIITFSTALSPPQSVNENSHASPVSIDADADGSRVSARILGQEVAFTLPVPGRHLVGNALAALAAAKLAGADIQRAAGALKDFQAPEGRGRRIEIEGATGPVLIIDETYNANPASMRAALENLGAVARAEFPRRIAVLGDMLELGHGGPQFHADLATSIDSNAIDLVWCAGPLMRHLVERLPSERLGGCGLTSAEIQAEVLDAVKSGDAVMIKGSLGSRMGPLVEALIERLETRLI